MTSYFVNEEYEDKDFVGLDLTDQTIQGISFFNCTFERCSFQYTDISSCSFDNCDFSNCNLSLAKLQATHLFDVRFTGCKLMGINWGNIKGLFKAEFADCVLDNTVFPNLNLQQFSFDDCTFTGASFIDCNLSYATFDDCDLEGCLFDSTNLTKANFSTAFGYKIDVSKNTIKQSRFSLPEAVSLLENFDIELV